MSVPARLVATMAATAMLLATPLALQRQRRAPLPQEPVSAILDVFRTHRVVAIGESHGNEQEHAFLRQLLTDPRFPRVVNDILVEFGNSKYQDVIDRFVRGGDVPYDELRKVWQNTTIPNPGWDRPVYEAFFRTVREVNASLPAARQLRVLLGDPPIDWDAPGFGGWRPGSTGRMEPLANDPRLERGAHAAGVLQREVLVRNRKAIAVFGVHHVMRGTNLVGARDTTVFSIGSATSHYLELMNIGVESWPVPSLIALAGTTLGTADSLFMFNPARSGTVAESAFDALLYLGPRDTMTESPLSRSLCADPGYMTMRLGRLALHPSWQRGAEELRTYCSI